MDGNDFSEAIDNLKRRASSARKTRSIIATVLFILSLIIFGIIYINTTSGLANGMSDVYKKLALNNNDKFNNGIENIYSNIINDSNSLAEDASSTSKIKSEKSKDSKLLQASQDNFERMIKNLEVKTKIMDSYAEWKGVRYKLGQGRDNHNICRNNCIFYMLNIIAFVPCPNISDVYEILRTVGRALRFPSFSFNCIRREYRQSYFLCERVLS